MGLDTPVRQSFWPKSGPRGPDSGHAKYQYFEFFLNCKAFLVSYYLAGLLQLMLIMSADASRVCGTKPLQGVRHEEKHQETTTQP